MKPIALLLIATTALTACTRNMPGTRSFFMEAGAFADSPDFGNATMNNTLVQSGERDYAVDLNRRFSADIPTTINFEFNSAVIDGTAQSILRQQADFIRQFPEVRFKVFGHTDLVGSDSYNQRLGLRRAQAVVAFLSTQGISRDRLEAVVSFGETQPLIVTQGQERANRRTVTEVSGFVQNNPAVMNGKYAEIVFREYVASGVPQTGLIGISGSELSTSQ